MSNLFRVSCPIFLCLILLSCCHIFVVTCTEFEVGGKAGWVIPKSKDFYNNWASENRFKVNDTLRFRYQTDSVMEVTEEEYDRCRSSPPIFFSNNGDTVFTFNQAGLFYFISGVGGHCAKGQKMIIKVLETHLAEPPQSADETAKKSHAAGIAPISKTIAAVLVVSWLGLFFA